MDDGDDGDADEDANLTVEFFWKDDDDDAAAAPLPAAAFGVPASRQFPEAPAEVGLEVL